MPRKRLPVFLRRTAKTLLVAGLSAATLAGIGTAGVVVTMKQSYRNAEVRTPAHEWPQAAALPSGRINVAVVLGATGSVSADVLAPFEVFARSDRFAVYTVAARRVPSSISGGLSVLPDHTLDEVAKGTLPRPDVVVVPAVVDPTGSMEAPLRDWISAQARNGSRVLGVCAGSELVAATGLLEGRRATSFWANIDSLERRYPTVNWKRGLRYVEDGNVTTTAGITSGTVGALRMIEKLAGADEARRVGQEVSYPGWSLTGPIKITENRLGLSDLPYALNAAFPWFRPMVGVALVDGINEIDVAAAAEGYSGVSFAGRTLPIGVGGTVTTRHGLVLLARPAASGAPVPDRLVVPGVADLGQVSPAITRWARDHALRLELPGGGRVNGEFGFDPVLRDLAEHEDRATARTTAKFSEYPSDHLELTGAAFPWRSTALAGLAVVVSVGIGFLPLTVRRVLARRRGEFT
jgi:putative intracellular protease/amidase